MRKPKAVLFDWDGTLYDSAKVCFKIYKDLFKRFGAGDITYDGFRREFSADYHTYQQKHGLGEDKWKDFDNAWYELYYSRADQSSPFPYADETLSTLHAMGVPLGLVTNANRKRMNTELKRLGMYKYFTTVVTAEDVGWELKPSPKPVERACDLLDVDRRMIIYIGDMLEDIISGSAAGVMTGAVPTGIHTLDKLLTGEPDFIFADARGVLEVLK
ncbi:MAG: HAD family hydrolase [Candidatus Micrarchaeota archaeon]